MAEKELFPIRRIAVLNRGEAAMRFIRGAQTWSRKHRHPLETIAFYTRPDAEAPFVKAATQAIALGEPLFTAPDGSRRSVYVDIDRMMDEVVKSGADALWPGWGFASESPELSEACAKRGVVFLGPPADAIRMVADKVEAKRLATLAGVPVSPWSEEPVADVEAARAHLERIGYPALLKSAAGGGGRGIRRVDAPSQLPSLFGAASAEAFATSGNASLFVEAFVTRARHVEVQIVADRHGTVWTLGTRDCSVQRRNQKLFEEAPAPGLDTAIEAALCDAARALAEACGYEGVGTAEFLLLPDDETFYFLEMNTRLQVEHTVTEAIYGVDLVGLQIDIARGLKLAELPVPEARGVAIEGRLNAEDPDDHFTPRTGVLVRFSPPDGPWVRVDTGYGENDTVPSCFDSNVAKIITWGVSREDAMARMQTALGDTLCALETGLSNRSLLLEIVTDSPYRTGPVWTRWLDDYLPSRVPVFERPHLPIALAAAAIGDHLLARSQDLLLFFAEAFSGLPRRMPSAGPRDLKYLVAGQAVDVQVATLAPRTYHVRCGAWEAVLRARSTGSNSLVLDIDGQRFSLVRIATANQIHVDVEGVAHRFERLSDGRVVAPVPSAVSFLHVRVGESVKAGDRLATLEAMKMEFPILSPLDGVVTDWKVGPSDTVAAGDVLLTIEPDLADGGEAGEGASVIVLPAHRRAELTVFEVLNARLLGYDVDGELALRALAALGCDEDEMELEELVMLLSTYVVMQSLFMRGEGDDATNEARESSAEQLGWFLRQRRIDEEVLSPVFVARLRHFFLLHQIVDVEASRRVDNALMRLFQTRHDREMVETVTTTILEALERRCPADLETVASLRKVFAWNNGHGRGLLEALATASARGRAWRLAAMLWNFIHTYWPASMEQSGVDYRLGRDFVEARKALWADFEVEELSLAQKHLGAFMATAVGTADRRLVVLAAAGQTDVVYEEGIGRLPGLERVFFDAATVLRDARLAAPRGRLPQWNRIILVTPTAVEFDRAVLEEFVRRVTPQMLDLSLDRVIIECASCEEETQIVEFTSPVGLGSSVVVHVGKPSGPGPLSKFEEGIIASHGKGIFYAYEVIDWLVSGRDQAIPAGGRFEEYDLDEQGRFVSVGARPYGENRANLVVGVIEHQTRRYPDRLKRVLIIGDATRTMGSLGEEECRRIEGAIDLAREHRLPVEWIPLSSGARIAFDSGTENLDWTARVVRKIVEFTQDGGTIHVIVDGPCVGAQSYWNAEATMLMHCKGALIMTPRGYMILTGRRALEYSGSVAAETNQALGGLEIMVPNGQAQYAARDLFTAYRILFDHYDLSYVHPNEGYTRPVATADPVTRDIGDTPLGEYGFARVGEIFDDETNPGRKRPFPIRAVMKALVDEDGPRVERWEDLEGGESAVTWLGQIGGYPVTLIGIESRPVRRRGSRPVDGPETWMSGTLFPQSSKKIARALNGASAVHPAVILANLSGFDGSPESLRHRQLELGAEIARGAVNFKGPIIFCVIARYHGGAFVVFSRALNEELKTGALEGTYASVIGGAPAAAVVFPSLVDRRTRQDPRVLEAAAPGSAEAEAVYARVRAEIQGQVAREFDGIHSIERARAVGSLDHILTTSQLRAFVSHQIEDWRRANKYDTK